MRLIPFIFVDNWNIISHLGETLTISLDDLENYRENNLSDSQIKSMAYSYLTTIPISDLQKTSFQIYEF